VRRVPSCPRKGRHAIKLDLPPYEVLRDQRSFKPNNIKRRRHLRIYEGC
jgi:hypothetical protein